MPNSKQIIYLSQAQYAELIANDSITVDGVTVTYDENDIYVTPQAEPVTDVRVAGTSVAANGVANIPVGDANTYGVYKANQAYGITNYNGFLRSVAAPLTTIQNGLDADHPIVSVNQHQSTFYGLAKASGDTTQSQSSNSVGTYTPEAKGAIQQMLGVSDLIATAENSLVASRAYAIGDVFTANGKLYKVTSAIAADGAIILQNEGETVSGANAEEIKLSDYAVHDVQVNGSSVMQNGVANVPVMSSSVIGVAKINGVDLTVDSGSKLLINGADNYEIRTASGASWRKAIIVDRIHAATFYGLAKAAGDATQSASANAVGTYTDDAKSAIKSMIGVNVEDVQVNGTSIVSNRIANLPVATIGGDYGTVKLYSGLGIGLSGQNNLMITTAIDQAIKNGTNNYTPITPFNQEKATFYGLAKAAGDTTMSSSSNAVGTYTDNAKASIKAMLGIVDGSTGTVDVSGTTPTITAVENTRYVCGEVATLSFTPPASGISIVRFTSGTTATVLTLPNTVKFPEWFDATSLEADTIYEICVTDGVYGAVMSWAL